MSLIVSRQSANPQTRIEPLCSHPSTVSFFALSPLPATAVEVTVYSVSLIMFLWLSPSLCSVSSLSPNVWNVSIITSGRGTLGLLLDDGPYILSGATGVAELVVILMRIDKRGRSAGNDPAMMPMPSSRSDQNPIFPVAYMNSPGSL
jgi:hypothetical protein